MSYAKAVFGVFMDTLYPRLIELRADEGTSDDDFEDVLARMASRIDDFRWAPRPTDSDGGHPSGSFTFPVHANSKALIRPKLTGRALAEARRDEVLKALSGVSGPVSLNEVMQKLRNAGVAEDSQRSTIVTLLSRMLHDNGLIERPFEGAYQITERGRQELEWRLNSQQGAGKPAPQE